MEQPLACCCACCHLLLDPGWAAVVRGKHHPELVMHRKFEGDIWYQARHVGTVAPVQRLGTVTEAAGGPGKQGDEGVGAMWNALQAW